MIGEEAVDMDIIEMQPDPEGLLNITVDTKAYTVMFHLNGNRNEDPTKVLDKMYSAYDSGLLGSAINNLVIFYNNHIRESNGE